MKASQFPKVVEVLNVEPFKVTCLWSTGQVRVNDFTEEMEEWKVQNYEIYLPLTNYAVFSSVAISEAGTLTWPAAPITFTFDGQTRTEPLDLDPIVLYETSKPLSAYRLVPVEQAA